MATGNSLFSLQGKFHSAKRDESGNIDLKSLVWLGNAEEATVEISVDKEDKKESFSGQRGVYGTIITGKTATLNITLDEWLPESLALGLFAKQVDIASSTVTAEEFPDNLKAGDLVKLDKLFVTDLVIMDAAGDPLLAGVDYEITSATAGHVKILKDIASQPVEASYKGSEAKSLAFLSEAQAPERFIIFDGVDTLNNKKVYMELYRVQFEPTSSFGLINESFGTLPLTGTLLIDSERLDNTELGGYGRIVTKE